MTAVAELPSFGLEPVDAFDVPSLDDRTHEWRAAHNRVGVFATVAPGGKGVLVSGDLAFGIDLTSTTVTVDRARIDEPEVFETFHRTIIPLLLAARGHLVLHASVVADEGADHPGAFAFMAPSMTGKSTTAYALEQRGFRALGDDSAVVVVEAGRAMLQPLRYRPKLRVASQEALGAPGERGWREPTESVPLTAVLSLERGGVDTPEVVAMRGSEQLKALLVNALYFELDSEPHRRRLVELSAELAGATRVATLRLPDRFEALDDVPAVLRSLR